MNRLLPIFSLLLSPLAFGNTTVPVGYNNIVLVPQSDTIIGVPFHRNPTYIYTIVDVDASAETIEVNATIPADAFNGALLGSDQFYLRVKDGPREGMWYHIVDHTADTFTVDSANDSDFEIIDSNGASDTQTLEVVPYWTLDTLLANGASLEPATGTTATDLDPAQGAVLTEVFFLTPEGPQTFSSSPNGGLELRANNRFVYLDNGSDTGWIDANDPTDGAGNPKVQGDVAFAPDSIFFLRNNLPDPGDESNNLSITTSGTVPDSDYATIFSLQAPTTTAEDIFFSNPYPVDLCLNDTGLSSPGSFFNASTSFRSPGGDFVLIYDRITDHASGRINRAADDIFFYYDGSDATIPFGPGWYNVNEKYSGEVGDQKVIPASGGLGVRKRATPVPGDGVVQSNKPY
ncbi:MAG: TIGR02597 family protein [Opitutales bacterium]